MNIKNTVIILFIIFFINCSSSNNNSNIDYDPGQGWTMVWSDEFNGSNLNLSNWSYRIGYGDIPSKSKWGWGVGFLCEFTDNASNSYIENGNLIIKAIYTGGSLTNRNYTSARVYSQNKISFKYGKIVGRMKMPYGKGTFPAFWMFGTNHMYGTNWPECGEIDIMEMKGGGENQDDTVLGTAHWSNDFHQSFQYISQSKEISDPNILADDYHTYAIEWDNSNIIWKLDGETYHVLPIDTNTYPERSELHNEMFLILNLGIGCFYEPPGNPDITTVFPQYMYIDWIRVYKK